MPSAPITRRRMLGRTAVALLSGGLLRSLEAAQSDGEFYFVVVNDIHHQTGVADRAWLERIARSVNGHPEFPAFCMLAGDLSEHGTPGELTDVRDAFRLLDMPVHVTPGNHDYRTEADRSPFEEVFGKRLQETFRSRGWQFVSFDSTENQRTVRTSIQPEAFQWLDGTLPALDRRTPTVVFTHFPLATTVVRPVNAADAVARFSSHRVVAGFGGHWHGFTRQRIGAATFFTNRCCALRRGNNDHHPAKGYLLCRASGGRVDCRFVRLNG